MTPHPSVPIGSADIPRSPTATRLSGDSSADDLTPGLLPETPDDLDPRVPRRPLWSYLTRGIGLVGLLLIAGVVAMGLFGDFLTPYSPTQQLDGAYLLSPNAEHWLGTDEVNRDVATRVIHGIRTSLVLVVIAVPIGAAIGTLIGLLSVGHPAADVAAQRTFDIILAFPALILGITLTTILGPGALTVGIVIAVAEIPIFGRLTRTAVLRIREMPYVEAARVSGASYLRILRTHVLPNSLEALGVQIALSFSMAIFIEGALSYLGIGVLPPTASLGSILASGNGYLETNPWISAGPLVVISALILGFYLTAQALSQGRREL